MQDKYRLEDQAPEVRAGLLKRDQRQFQTLVENLPDMIVRFDHDLHIIYANPAARAFISWLPQTFLGKTNTKQAVPDKILVDWQAAIRQTFESGQSFAIKLAVPNPDHATYYFQTRFMPEFAEDGSVESVLSITSDITGLKQAVSASLESERFARLTFDTLQEQICVLDESGIIVAVNKAWRNFTGVNFPLNKRTCEGANYLAVCETAVGPGSEDAQAFASGLRAVMLGERDDFALEYVCDSLREKRWFLSSVTPIQETGSMCMMITHRDVTNRKLAEQSLREAIAAAEQARREAEVGRLAEVERRQFAESLRDILSVLNSNHCLNEVLNEIALKAEQLLKSQGVAIYTTEEETGGLLIQVVQGSLNGEIPGNEILRGLEALRQAMLTRQPVAILDVSGNWSGQEAEDVSAGIMQGPDCAQHASSNAFYRALLAVPIVVKNETFGGMMLYYTRSRPFSDDEIKLAVTFSDQVAFAIENARLSDQIKEAAVAAERNRLAHDLHDAVTQSIYSASLIAEAMPRVWEHHPEEGRRGMEELRKLTRGALAEMRALLVELRPAAITQKKPGELLHHLSEAMASRSQVPVEFSVLEDRFLPPEVQVALYRIAQEALNNVIRHASASQVKVSLNCQPEWVELSIKDNGTGFDPKDILPERLGLGIMRERAREIGARLEIDSSPGQGTLVIVKWLDPHRRRTLV